MELEVASVSFALPASLPAEPPEDYTLKADATLNTSIGTLTVAIYELEAIAGGDWWAGVYLEANHLDLSVDLTKIWGSMHLACGPPAQAAAGDRGSGAGWHSGRSMDLPEYGNAWADGDACGMARAIKYSKLRAPAAAGHELRFVFVLCPQGGGTPLGPNAALRVPSPVAGSLSAEQLFGGPFSDVTVVCSGERFPAHRAVLAMASPVFLSMLTSGMAEGGAAEVEIREADPAVLELLLRHAYGAAVEVPLALAPQLCGLADRFQLRTHLAEQLTLWLSTVEVEPAALCELLPAAHTLCPYACHTRLYEQPSMYEQPSIAEFAALSGFGLWPLEVVVAVVANAKPAKGLALASAWMAAQPRPARQRHRWPELLDAVRWGKATHEGLKAMRESPGAAAVPGLQERVLDAYHDLCCKYAEAQASDSSSDDD